MILILSEAIDISTNKIVEWLKFYKAEYLRIDREFLLDSIHKVAINNNFVDIEFKYNNKYYRLNDFAVILCRRGAFHSSFNNEFYSNQLLNYEAKQQIHEHLQEESKTLLDFVYGHIRCKSINDPRHYNSNKLITLEKAVEVGFCIPETIVTTQKNHVLEMGFPQINKNIQDLIIYSDNDISFHSKVIKIKIETDVDLDTEFGISLFQKEVNNITEIRVFIFKNKTFSVGQVKENIDDADIRNNSLGNKIFPIQLPRKEEFKLFKLLKLLDLETASVDLIYNGKEFVFLEVNPVGQFDYVSVHGNYLIEEYIAKELINHGKKTRNISVS